MKKVQWTLALAVFAIIICGFCLFYVTAISDEAENRVNKIQSNITNFNYTEAESETGELDEFWQSQHTGLAMLVHHQILEEIEESIALIKTSVETADRNQENADFWFESTRALTRIKNLKDTEVPSLSNIL